MFSTPPDRHSYLLDTLSYFSFSSLPGFVLTLLQPTVHSSPGLLLPVFWCLFLSTFVYPYEYLLSKEWSS